MIPVSACMMYEYLRCGQRCKCVWVSQNHTNCFSVVGQMQKGKSRVGWLSYRVLG